MASFGEVLKAFREKKNKTAKEIADELGMDRAYYSRMENDRHASTPRQDTLDKISSALRLNRFDRFKLFFAAGKLEPEIERMMLQVQLRPEVLRLLKIVVKLKTKQVEDLLKHLENNKSQN